MKVIFDKNSRDAADELIQCLRSVTLEKFVKHTLIIHMAGKHRYEIYARIVEDLGEPVYLYDLAHQHPSFSQDLRLGVGTMQLSRFHEFGNAEKTIEPNQEFLQIIESRIQPLKRWIEQFQGHFPPFFYRYQQHDEYLVETIIEPFSLSAQHFR